jgi:hypothetical protein
MGNSVTILECKGYINNDVTENEVRKWLTESIPRIRASLLVDPFYQKKGDFKFRFWTTSKFSADAVTFLQSKKQEIKKFSFDWLDGPALLKLAKASKNEYASRILREQYRIKL